MPEPAPSLRHAITVSDLVRRLRRLIEDNIQYVWVEGEISEHKIHRPSGHHYFTLKDEKSILNCAMWKALASKLAFKPEAGLEVFAFGRLDIYPPRGTYQLLVERMEPKGAGALQIRFEELKKRLAAEGLFDEKRKRPLPPFPAAVAIVTSPAGAAIRDMLRIISTRYPKVLLLMYPVPVQGDGAADSIARAIGEINLQRPDVDVLIVGRGGGSLEDLWAFNEEAVARAIFRSQIPVVSAVGHETDFTIADFTADVRAATPTDAANRVVPDLGELTDRLRELERAVVRRPRNLHETHVQRADELQARLLSALSGATLRLHQRVEGFGTSLHASLPRLVQETRRRLNLLARAGGFTMVERGAERHRQRLLHLASSMAAMIDRTLSEARQRESAAAGRLEALSPLRVLRRGYSITLDGRGRVLSDAAQAGPGDRLDTRLARGRIRSRVEESFAGESAGDTMARP